MFENIQEKESYLSMGITLSQYEKHPSNVALMMYKQFGEKSERQYYEAIQRFYYSVKRMRECNPHINVIITDKLVWTYIDAMSLVGKKINKQVWKLDELASGVLTSLQQINYNLYSFANAFFATKDKSSLTKEEIDILQRSADAIQSDESVQIIADRRKHRRQKSKTYKQRRSDNDICMAVYGMTLNEYEFKAMGLYNRDMESRYESGEMYETDYIPENNGKLKMPISINTTHSPLDLVIKTDADVKQEVVVQEITFKKNKKTKSLI